MLAVRDYFSRLRRKGEEGATAVEYGIMVALIAAVIVAVIVVLGKQVKEGFCTTAEALNPVSTTKTGTAC